MDALHEHSPESFHRLIDEIEAQGYGREVACHFAALIGDTPLTDKDGNIIVTENDQEIARLNPLKMFQKGKFELLIYRGDTLVETWRADQSLDFMLSTGAVQVPGWKEEAAIESVAHEFKQLPGGRRFLERTIVHIR
jgi:hypothetical protein